MSDYDIYHLGISGGKDSTAALLWMVYESGYPREKLNVTFCDTGNEHAITYQYIEMLREKIFPIQTIKPPDSFYELAARKKRFPSAKARFCTEKLKIIPTQEYTLSLMQAGNNVLLHSGVRAEESPARAEMEEREFDGFYACDIYRPLLKWSIEDVWKILAKYGIPRNPLYDFGARRVGCFPCIMSSKEEIRIISTHFPERIDMIREKESQVGEFGTFFPRKHVPLAFRSKEIVCKDGRKVKVPTIDDVVLWSQTAHGGKQYAMHFDKPMACNSNTGMCE